MKTIVLGLIIILTYAIYKKVTNKNQSFFEKLTTGFPKYTILKKIDTYLICDCKNIRNEPEELVFIRINHKRKKRIRKRDNRIIATYPTEPTLNEMKKDFGKYLN